jgi:shikimate dehydrogenase
MDINAHTQFCGVIGNPVEHSLSPAIHNAAFQKLGVNCVYLAWRVEAIGDAIKGLRALGNFRGASVTIPHKVSSLPWLDQLDATAANIGAINTIVADQGRLTGYNTDATGALRALKEGGVALNGRHIVLLGSGGAARAIAFGLAAQSGADKLTVLGIDDQERARLAGDVRSKTALTTREGRLDEETLGGILPHAQVLVHCTPIGMFPNMDASCVPASLLHSGLTVMDIVYNPRETRLLKDAKRAGCQVVPGLEMFLHQAAAQCELWTGQAAPVDVMRAVLESRFQ